MCFKHHDKHLPTPLRSEWSRSNRILRELVRRGDSPPRRSHNASKRRELAFHFRPLVPMPGIVSRCSLRDQRAILPNYTAEREKVTPLACASSRT